METISEGRDTSCGIKLCLACGVPNHAQNAQCANCSWQGGFDYDREHVLESLAEIQQYVGQILERELGPSLIWRQSLTVSIKSLKFTIRQCVDST
jgi:hypothetical protein